MQMIPDQSVETILVSAEAVAKMLDISERSVWRLLSSGRMLRPIRLGGSVRWRLAEVKDWIAAGCPAAGSK